MRKLLRAFSVISFYSLQIYPIYGFFPMNFLRNRFRLRNKIVYRAIRRDLVPQLTFSADNLNCWCAYIVWDAYSCSVAGFPAFPNPPPPPQPPCPLRQVLKCAKNTFQHLSAGKEVKTRAKQAAGGGASSTRDPGVSNSLSTRKCSLPFWPLSVCVFGAAGKGVY